MDDCANFFDADSIEDVKLRNDLKALLAKKEKWQEDFSTCLHYQNEGRALEKSKDYEQAIISYEKAVSYGETSSLLQCNDYLYSIQRLAVLYRRMKRYSDEVAVLKLGLRHRHDKSAYAPFFERLASRLAKAKQLLSSNH